MDESLLHYVWKLQRYDRHALSTHGGVELQVTHPGTHSSDAGPDFVGARIRIGDVDWTGNVEIHVNSRDWFVHKHHEDAGYDNVILHVVWQHQGGNTLRSDGSQIPVFELKGRVEEEVLLRYSKLSEKKTDIPCAGMLPAVPEIVRLDMVDHAMARRLERKAQAVEETVRKTNNHWEEATYRLLVANFGFKTNSAPFAQLARAVPHTVLQRNANNLQRVEAILFGTAGFLAEDPLDEYQRTLRAEYRTYSVKYDLHHSEMPVQVWKFSRMRPAGFPTVRIAQLAACIAKTPRLLDSMLYAGSSDEIRALFDVGCSEYWTKHYHFGRPSARRIHGLGAEAVSNIMINTVVPVIGAYGILHDDQAIVDRATALLASIKPESNRITRRWKSLGMCIRNAAETQGLIELYNEYCAHKRCAACKIGSRILKGS
jgi:hypothetical protein